MTTNVGEDDDTLLIDITQLIGGQLHMEVGYRCAAPVYGFLRLLPPGVWVRILNIFSFPRSMGMIYPNLSYFPYFYSRYPYLLLYKIFGN